MVSNITFLDRLSDVAVLLASSDVISVTGTSANRLETKALHLVSSLTSVSFLLHVGPAATVENERTQMQYKDMLPSTPLLRWVLALFFIGATVAVGLYAM